MDRRAFIGSLALATLAVPRAARAQPARKVYRSGIIGQGVTADLVGPQPRNPIVNGLLRGLQELGYVYGEHFVTEPRGAKSRPERYPSLAADLVRLQVDVIVPAAPALSALKQATSTIPIVMPGDGDPVGRGFVQSLRRPGGNITELSLQAVETTGKRLELLKELGPAAALIAVLWDRFTLPYWQAADAAARGRGWKLLSLEIQDGGDIEGAFRAATDARAGALLVSGGLFLPQARRVAELAAKSRLPTMYSQRPYVDAGGLISYSADLIGMWWRAATYVDKILKGAKPADLPVEQPTKFELVVKPARGEGARSHDPAVAAAAGGSGHRVARRRNGRRCIRTDALTRARGADTLSSSEGRAPWVRRRFARGNGHGSSTNDWPRLRSSGPRTGSSCSAAR
jgi:putative ABC transport system substrate-binding protein